MIDAAIVGLGRWGKGFLESVQGRSRRIRFVRGVDTDPDVARGLAARHGFKPSSDLAEALADPAVQALVLVTPHSLHREQVVACALAGKHVFCEKPLALTKADAQIMIAACARAGVVLGVGHNRRLWPSMQRLGRAVEGGELGQVLHLEGHFSNEHSNKVSGGWRLSPGESPGGGMTGAGLHVLDAFIHLAGPVRRVHAQLLERKPAPAPLDTVSAIYEFANGASGLLGTVRATPQYWRVHVFGANGSAEALGENELVLHGAASQRLSLEPVDSLRAELEMFANAIETRAAFPIPAAQMLATVAAFEATIRSLESDATIILD
ncbi:MAG TPA: Gfo/Idh/MocA family oxidoreductase [Burkholderiales bacterium]|nr:Gfo/Idh/MocA family oxidoreductase [Burkholderiales bacterium]